MAPGARRLRERLAGAQVELAAAFHDRLPTADQGGGALLLRRLVFLWFLQEGGLLGEPDCLLHALERSAAHGPDRFYPDVLHPLLEPGAPAGDRRFPLAEWRGPLAAVFAADSRQPCAAPPVPDRVLARLFTLLRGYCWTLDEGCPEDEQRLDPSLLGSLVETDGGRKQAGVYYTGADAAGYIARNTLIPWLFDRVGRRCPDLFGADGPVRRLFREAPDRYLYPALRHGADLPLPEGLAPGAKELGARGGWDRPADAAWGLPAETWRECFARRERCRDVHTRLAAGEVRSIADCVTLNLDLPRLARDLLEQADPALAAVLREALAGIKILDPTCGSGAFLLAALNVLEPLLAACADERAGDGRAAPVRTLVERNLYGVDIQPGAVETCRMRLFLRFAAGLRRPPGRADLPRFNIVAANILDSVPAPPGALWARRFDAVLGNPPFVPLSRDRLAAMLPPGAFRTESCGSLFAPVVERACSLLAPDGVFGMVVPVSAVSTVRMAPLARITFDRTVWISTYANRPGKLFGGVEQRLAILLRKGGGRQVFSTSYQHWYEGERETLFARLAYHPSWLDPQTGMPLKLGSALERGILERLSGCGESLLRLSRPGPWGCWFHDGPTYWIRALPFEPGQASRGGHAGHSGHYHRLPAATEADALALAAILSSSTFYLYFKAVSNCRDLGNRELEGFRLPSLTAVLKERLADAGRGLAETLRRTARRRRRLYPSGPVEYEEYYPARARDFIDRIDGLLAALYRFSAEELDFIAHKDIKYRLTASDP